jgi:hypothetical protein
VALQIKYSATSDQACVVDVLGEFKPGETKEFSDAEVQMFEKIHLHRLADSHFAPWFHLTVHVIPEPEAKTEDKED